jgi:hypothetical protein
MPLVPVALNIKADGEDSKLVSPRLVTVAIVSSADSLRSSRNSEQAPVESSYCIPSTLFNRR